MRKKLVLGVSILVLTTSIAACGSEENEVNTVEIDISNEQEDKRDVILEETASSQSNDEEVSIGNARTALSDSTLEINEGEYPEGIAAEFTYFMYDTEQGMVQAQKYLEEIGVSEEGKKLVVLQETSGIKQPVYIEVIYFEEEGSYTQIHYFATGEKVFNDYISNDVNESAEFSDLEARYVRSKKVHDTVSFSYDELVQYYESTGVYKIVK